MGDRKERVEGKEDFTYWSEETCEHCSELFDTKSIITTCPDCKKIVVACNACDNLACGKCKEGAYFNLYGTDREINVDDLEEIAEKLEWFDGGIEEEEDA